MIRAIQKRQGLWLAVALMLLMLLAGMVGASAEDAYAWTETGATMVTLADAGTTIEGAGASVADSVVTIQSAGTYVLRGSLTDGQVHVNAGKNDIVQLVLDGVDITNGSGPAMLAEKAETIVLILAEGSENRLADGTTYTDPETADAALYVQDDLAIGGTGSLCVDASYNNGIVAKDELTVDGGVITVVATNDGIRGRDGLTIHAGDITVTAGNDGLKANNDEDAEKGWIALLGGTLRITAGQDGIQAETTLTVDGTTMDVVAGGGAANAPTQGAGNWGPASTEDETGSQKGLKAGAGLTIRSGSLTVDAADDALHTNGAMEIAGGEMTLRTGDDGAHADGVLLITGGTISIKQSYEGLEGSTVEIQGGMIDIIASDDGINSAGGSDEETTTGGWGRDAFGGGTANPILISGGTVAVSAEGDGLDANGDLTIAGGEVTVHGPARGGNGALDANGTIVVTGGRLMLSDGASMLEMPGSTSTQPTLAVYYNDTLAVGDTVVLSDATGTVLATFTVQKAHRLVAFSMPELALGETYQVTTTRGVSTAVTLSAVVTTVDQSGAATSMGGRGFGGGGRRN